MDKSNTPSAPSTQTLAGIPLAFPGFDVPGVLIPPEWAIASGEPVAESGPAPVSELDEIRDGLQESLLEKPRYQAPDIDHLLQLAKHVPVASRNAKIEHPEDCERVAELSTPELAERVAVWVHRHRRRGLSELDLACQREWTARALGVGYFYGKGFRPWLPGELVDLQGARRGAQRETVLAALCLAMVKGRNGICIGAPDAEMLWKIPASTWWALVASLEKSGLLVRMRRFKNNDVKGQAPVHLCPNWYGPGPVLLAKRETVFAAFRVGFEALAAELREQERLARCARRREINKRLRTVRRRRLGLRELGRPAPSWAMRVAAELHGEQLERCEHDYATERGRAVRDGTSAPSFGQPPPDPRPVESLSAELVAELVAAGVETEAQLAAVVDAQRTAIETAPRAGADAREPVSSVLGASGGRGGGDPVSPAALAPSHLTVQLSDGAPLGPESPKFGRAAGETGSPPPRPPDAPRTDDTGSRASAPAIPPQPVGGPPGPGGEPIPGAPARGAPRASEGATFVPPPATPKRTARVDAAVALGVQLAMLPDAHPLRGWRPDIEPTPRDRAGERRRRVPS